MKFATLAAAIAAVFVGSFGLMGSTPFTRPGDEQPPARIAWYATLESGLAEARRTNRPILFTSAAPQCLGVSGIW